MIRSSQSHAHPSLSTIHRNISTRFLWKVLDRLFSVAGVQNGKHVNQHRDILDVIISDCWDSVTQSARLYRPSLVVERWPSGILGGFDRRRTLELLTGGSNLGITVFTFDVNLCFINELFRYAYIVRNLRIIVGPNLREVIHLTRYRVVSFSETNNNKSLTPMLLVLKSGPRLKTG